MELAGGDFERKIFVKKDAGPLAARDLLSRGLNGEHIAIGSATDPYQPAEKEFGATRAILEEMARLDGLSVSITTKSNLVLRDIELLKRIGARSEISVNMSVTTPHARLARLIEPRAPRPDLRLAAVRELRQAGIAAGVFVIPVLPGLTDAEEDLDALARGASEAGAGWFGAGVLFLMPASREQFMPFLRKKFPLGVVGFSAAGPNIPVPRWPQEYNWEVVGEGDWWASLPRWGDFGFRLPVGRLLEHLGRFVGGRGIGWAWLVSLGALKVAHEG